MRQKATLPVIKYKFTLANSSKIYNCDTLQIVYSKQARARLVIHFRMFHNAGLVRRLLIFRNGEQWLTQINKRSTHETNIQLLKYKLFHPEETKAQPQLRLIIHTQSMGDFSTLIESGGRQLSEGYNNASDYISQRYCRCWELVYCRSGLYFKLHSFLEKRPKNKKRKKGKFSTALMSL